MVHSPQDMAISQAKLWILKQPKGATLAAEQPSPNHCKKAEDTKKNKSLPTLLFNNCSDYTLAMIQSPNAPVQIFTPVPTY